MLPVKSDAGNTLAPKITGDKKREKRRRQMLERCYDVDAEFILFFIRKHIGAVVPSFAVAARRRREFLPANAS